MESQIRTGLGYDIHRLVSGRPFLLGGVRLPSDKGPLGHSDGDPLLHAAVDALLGAAGLGDIGKHFPDNDPQWKDAESSLFLKETIRLIRGDGWEVSNLDANLLLESPKLAPHIGAIKTNVARLMEIPEERINLKAKRGEGMDAVGRGEAVAVQVIVLLSKKC